MKVGCGAYTLRLPMSASKHASKRSSCSPAWRARAALMRGAGTPRGGVVFPQDLVRVLHRRLHRLGLGDAGRNAAQERVVHVGGLLALSLALEEPRLVQERGEVARIGSERPLERVALRALVAQLALREREVEPQRRAPGSNAAARSSSGRAAPASPPRSARMPATLSTRGSSGAAARACASARSASRRLPSRSARSTASMTRESAIR